MQDFVNTLKRLPNRELANLGFMVWIALWLVAGFFISSHGVFYYVISILSGIGLFMFVYGGWNMTQKGKKEEVAIGWVYLVIAILAAIFWVLVKVGY